MSLTRRLLVSYIAIVVATAAVLTVAADRGLRSRLEARLTQEFEREARYLAFAARGLGEAGLDSLVHSLGIQTGRRLTIIGRDGRVLADTDFPRDQLGTLENHATRPEVAEALAGRVGINRRRSTSTGEDELKVALPGPGAAAVVRVSARVDHVNEVVRNAQGAVLGGASIALAIAAVLSLGFSARVARPLRRLSDAAQAIAAGGHPTLDVRGRDEVGQLARALRNLDESLGSRLRMLELGRAETTAVITSMVEGVIACDAKGRITLMNPAARALLDLDPDSQPPPIHELFRHHHAADAVATALSGQTVSGVETEVNGRQVLVSGHSLPNGGAVLVTHDVTWLRRVEAVRRDFVANVSHEMRTPLTVMRGYAETLLSDDPPPDLRARFLRSILEHARRLQRLVDDLLDLSRIEAGAWQPDLTSVSVEQVAREAWQDVTAALDGKTLELRTEIAPDAGTIRADREMLRVAIANLFENAVRHTPADGRVALRSARTPAGVLVSVADTGEGIPSEYLQRIFERFFRVDLGRERSRGGTGLGLAIVKHIVEAHGGRVEATSTLGQGTTITMRFPA